MKNITFEHLKGYITLICVTEVKLFEDMWKQLEKFSLNFRVVVHFHPSHHSQRRLLTVSVL